MSIKDIFESMDYGPAPESPAPATDWIAAHRGRFGPFIGGAFRDAGETFATASPADGETLAQVTQSTQADVDAAVAAARRAQPGWEGLGGPARARVLYALGRAIQKHSRRFAVLESLDVGKPFREARDIDVALASRHFHYHAGLAQLLDDERPGARAAGVCGQVIPWNFPLLMLSWKLAPALAAGCTVVLKPAEDTPLTALAFADICAEAGVPPGVVNLVTGDGAVGAMIVDAPVDKLAFTGSTSVGRRIREATAGRGLSLTLELGGKSPYVVFEDADLDSAVEGLVDAIWFNGGQVCCAGSRLLVQEGVAERFHAKLLDRMGKLRVGHPLDKAIDVGPLVSRAQRDRVAAMVDATAGTVRQGQAPDGPCWYPPTLVTDLGAADPLMRDEVFGPVLASMTFRTPDEAVMLANDTRYGLAASVWSEDVNVALGVAPRIQAGIVWVNGTNMMDAAAPFGGMRETGFGREGGWEGLDAYLRAPAPAAAPKPGKRVKPGAPGTVDRTAKFYIGGKQARPDGGQSVTVAAPDGTPLGTVGLANRKDLRGAVEAMNAASGWAGTTGHLRSQILYYIAENLSARAEEFARRLGDQTGRDGAAEVAEAIDILFTAAAWADKVEGRVKGVPLRGVAMAMRPPTGKIGLLAPTERPLAGLLAAAAPAIAMGCRVTVLARADAGAPLTVTDLYQVLETSDLPGGVLNLLTGTAQEVMPHMAAHLDLDAVWAFGAPDWAGRIEAASAGNLKRTWIADAPGPMRAVLDHATEVQTIWIPFGA
ncbi:MAG: aldehyde dehydrogenase family protein [Paracoccaceae bacterium]